MPELSKGSTPRSLPEPQLLVSVRPPASRVFTNRVIGEMTSTTNALQPGLAALLPHLADR